ncbi:MAG: DUF2752 domain-containing protein [Ignavibacteria bacterium]|nr:DUF2752 domain-containing protein [Ignavibacteria bacterium]
MRFLYIEKTDPSESAKTRIYLLLVIFFVVITTYLSPLKLIRFFFPEMFNRASSCILLNITGIPCIFCGLTRSFEELASFNLLNSFYYNPSSVFIFTFLAVVSLSIFILSLYNYKIRIVSGKKTLIAVTVVIVTVWIMNILFGHH